MDDCASNSISAGPDGASEIDSAAEQDFLDGPDLAWVEPPFEQKITVVGNARNFYYYGDIGEGLTNVDQDMAAIISKDETEHPFHHGLLDDDHDALGLDDSTETQSQDVRPFSCVCSRPCQADDIHETNLYESLSSDDSIRLIEILPGAADDPLNCRLHVAQLSHVRVSYEALSYSWEIEGESWGRSPLPKTNIFCSGIELPIGYNLFQAVRRIRQPLSSRIIWADALCINQEDVKERSHQVRKMSSIFQKASRVLVWLGEGEKSSPFFWDHASRGDPSHAFAGVCRVVNAWQRSKSFTSKFRTASYSSLGQDHNLETCAFPLSADSPIWTDILNLFRCRWFSRVWVIQEAALAKAATILWGPCEISWEWVGLAAAIVRTNFNRLLPSMRHGKDFTRSQRARVMPTGVLNAYFIYRISHSQRYFKPLSFSFRELLMLTRQFGCKDPRDRIFGILGVPTTDQVTEQAPFIQVDYAKSTAEVYHEVARKIIERSSSLALLSSAQGGRELDLPSWVPQWNYVAAQTLTLMEPSPNFAPAGRKGFKCKEQADTNRLVVCGIDVGAVSGMNRVSHSDFRRGQIKEDLTKDFLRRRKAAGEARYSPYEPYGSADDRLPLEGLLEKMDCTKRDLEELALTLTAGKNWYGLPVHDVSAHLADFSKCLTKEGMRWSLRRNAFGEDNVNRVGGVDAAPSRLASNPEMTSISGSPKSQAITTESLQSLAQRGNADRFLDAAATAGKGRARFTIAPGMRGVGPAAVKVGDRVCVVYGADVPFVLRPDGDGYKVVGECYVHGLMHGEAVRWVEQGVSGLEEKWLELF